MLLSGPPGYRFDERARPRLGDDQTMSTNHGGVAVYFKSTFTCQKIEVDGLRTMEVLMLRLCHTGHTLVLATIYSLQTWIFSSE